jgi:tetratricopeptide (TPR) repeat protein
MKRALHASISGKNGFISVSCDVRQNLFPMKRIVLAAFLIASPLAAQTDPHAALEQLEKAVAENPRSADAHYRLGVAYGRVAEKASIFRQPALARHTRDEFERAVRLDPNHLDARFALVEYYTIAPAFLGGSRHKALQQAQQIRARDAGVGDEALAFVTSRSR